MLAPLGIEYVNLCKCRVSAKYFYNLFNLLMLQRKAVLGEEGINILLGHRSNINNFRIHFSHGKKEGWIFYKDCGHYLAWCDSFLIIHAPAATISVPPSHTRFPGISRKNSQPNKMKIGRAHV